MACPTHVSGVAAALGLSYAKKLGKTSEPAEFRDMVLASATIWILRILRALKPIYLILDRYGYGIGFDGSMEMADYRGKYGFARLIDAYKMLMAVRGLLP